MHTLQIHVTTICYKLQVCIKLRQYKIQNETKEAKWKKGNFNTTLKEEAENKMPVWEMWKHSPIGIELIMNQ